MLTLDGTVPESLCRSCSLADHEPKPRPLSAPASPGGVPACRWRGGPTGELSPCAAGCCERVKLKLHGCDVHARCTLAKPSESGAAVCVGCHDAKAHDQSPALVRWIGNARLARDSATLAGMLPHDCGGIVGIPRSGMMPATLIATQLYLPLYTLTSTGPVRSDWTTSRGCRGGKGPLAVVDDTVYAGHASWRARELLTRLEVDHVIAAVYCTPWMTHAVDHYAAVLPPPHVLEWNWANVGPNVGRWDGGDARNRVWGGGVACDMDGILCEEPRVPDADSGPGLERYRQWILGARPLMLPRMNPIKLVVTGRVERWRPETEAWLAKRGVRVERLVMHPAATAGERDRAGDVAAMKGREFAASRCGIFIESDPRQCGTIHEVSGKVVICPATEGVWQP